MKKLTTLLLSALLASSGSLSGMSILADEVIVEKASTQTPTLDITTFLVGITPSQADVKVFANNMQLTQNTQLSVGDLVTVEIAVEKGYYIGFSHYQYSTDGNPLIPTNTEEMKLVSTSQNVYFYQFNMPAYNTQLRVSVLSYAYSTSDGLNIQINSDATSATISPNWQKIPEITDLASSDVANATYEWAISEWNGSSTVEVLNSSSNQITITLADAQKWGIGNEIPTGGNVVGNGYLRINDTQVAVFSIPVPANYLTKLITDGQTISAEQAAQITSKNQLVEILGATELYPLGYEVYTPAASTQGGVSTLVAAGPKGDEVTLQELLTPGTHTINVFAGSNELVGMLNRTGVEYGQRNITYTIAEGTTTPDVPTEPDQPTNPENPFSDVQMGQWYTTWVLEANKLGLMMGSDGRFNLDGNLIRGDLALVLYRLAGKPPVTGTLPFTDVPANEYYTTAILWAYQNGIITGYTGTTEFRPNNPVSRGELVTMLSRYTTNILDSSLDNQVSLNNYPDVNEVEVYARIPMAWGVANGILSGKDLNDRLYLAPNATATRVEAAKMLVSFYNLDHDLLD